MIPQLNTSEFVRSVIRDMRLTDSDPTMQLEMHVYASKIYGICHTCAGGSAVIHGMGGSRFKTDWSQEQWDVAYWCNDLLLGNWVKCELRGYPVPQEVKDAHRPSLELESDPDFWESWEAIADAFEAAEKRGWDPKGGTD